MASSYVGLSERQWERVKTMGSHLKHLFAVTKNLRSNDLTPGLLFKQRNSVVFRLAQFENPMSEDILQSMQRSE